MMLYAIIILAVVSRFIPHMPNVGLITALAMFSAVNLSWKKSLGITLIARFVSDIFLGFFAWPLMLAVYASHLVGILFGLWIKKHTTPSASASTPPLQEGNIAVFSPPAKEEYSAIAGGGGTNYWIRVIFSALGSSVIFFLVTNFAFLYPEYPHNFAGIALAYTNGLPFLRGTIIGDLGYSLALFGSFALVKYFVGLKSNILSPYLAGRQAKS